MTKNLLHVHGKLVKILVLIFISGIYYTERRIVHFRKIDYVSRESKQSVFEKLSENRTLILGLGTGRCGTLAVSKLLNQQIDSDVSHEWRRCRGYQWYEKDASLKKKKVDRFFKSFMIRSDRNFIGDVALYQGC